MKSVENCGLNRWQSYNTTVVYTVYVVVSCLKIERKDIGVLVIAVNYEEQTFFLYFCQQSKVSLEKILIKFASTN